MATKRTNSQLEELFNEALREVAPDSCTLFDHYDWANKQVFVWPDEDWTHELSEQVKALLRITIHSKLLISCLEKGRLSL